LWVIVVVGVFGVFLFVWVFVLYKRILFSWFSVSELYQAKYCSCRFTLAVLTVSSMLAIPGQTQLETFVLRQNFLSHCQSIRFVTTAVTVW